MKWGQLNFKVFAHSVFFALGIISLIFAIFAWAGFFIFTGGGGDSLSEAHHLLYFLFPFVFILGIVLLYIASLIKKESRIGVILSHIFLALLLTGVIVYDVSFWE